MELTQDFLPIGVRPKLSKMWRTSFIYPLIAITLFQAYITMPLLWHLTVELFCILLLLLFLIFYQYDVSVSISGADNTLRYRFGNCFGVVRQTTVNLPTASVSYELVSARYWSDRRQLRLNNGRFKNTVNLLQNPDYGFTAEQLDRMTELICNYTKIKR